MDEQIVSLLGQILEELKQTNKQLNIITHNGSYDLLDICNKLDTIDSSLSNIDTSIGSIQILLT